MQLALSGKGMSEQAVFDLAINIVRTPLVTVPGAAIPFPYGGKIRQIQVDLDPAGAAGARPVGQRRRQRARRAEPDPAGRHAEDRQLRVRDPAQQRADATSTALNDLPVTPANGAIVYLRDVAHVRDGNPPQTNIVHVDGGRAVLLHDAEERRGLDARHRRRHQGKLPPSCAQTLPDDLKITPLGDQSVFVEAAISGVVREARDRRRADRPDDPAVPRQLALDADHRDLDPALDPGVDRRCCAALGETLNIMTLGGLALAVGILVDDATVTIENINWHLEQGKDVETAILDGARQIVDAGVRLDALHLHRLRADVLPRAASPRFLFVPLAEAVVFAMIALVRPVAHAGADDGELPAEAARRRTAHGERAARRAIRWSASSAASRRASSASARVYRDLLALALARRAVVHRRLPGLRAWRRSRWRRSSAATSSRRSMPARSSCTCARRPARGSRRRANQFADIEKAIRQIIPPRRARDASSTTSACRSAAST